MAFRFRLEGLSWSFSEQNKKLRVEGYCKKYPKVLCSIFPTYNNISILPIIFVFVFVFVFVLARLCTELMAMNSESNDQSSLTITCIPGAPPMKPCEINTFLKPCDPSDFIFSFIMRSFTLALQCSHILLHTYDTLEVEGLAFIQSKPNILTIGPLLPTPFLDMIKTSSCNHYNLCNHHEKLEASSLWVENGKCLAWLDSQDPSSVLYLSFGSIAIMSDQQMAELMDALEATRYPILMVARDTNTFVEDKDLHDKITSMNSGKMMVVKWAPQLKVLGHPAIGFLTHCGWNSTFEAICKGVPMLCWPFFCDQMLNCRYVGLTCITIPL